MDGRGWLLRHGSRMSREPRRRPKIERKFGPRGSRSERELNLPG
ncbi:hypothetical protein TAMC210_07240 [Thermanaeromonas sp. C210]|nr:hypothetical protein TAMC210_07240 [Thermanaeromonas sp. C210]